MNQKCYLITRPSLAIPLIVVVSGITFFWALGEPAYWDRDEPRNAGCAAEMMARGDWVVPIFNDQLRQQKPPLLYWLMGVSYSVFGVNEFAGRFFSALLAIGTVLATWSITRRFYDEATALLASLMLSSSLMFCVAARAATPDSVLIFCISIATMFFVRGYVKTKRNPFYDRGSFLGIYLFLGLAMLAKGPVGFLLPMAVMGWFLLQEDWIANRSEQASTRGARGFLRQLVEPFAPLRFWRTLCSMRVISGLALSLLVAAPWFIAVGLATEGEFLKRFFLEENLGRATQVLENHSGGPWYYPLAILIGFFPWSMFWGPVVVGLVLDRGRNSNAPTDNLIGSAGVRLAITWVLVQVVAFSLVKTKLPSYVTPCYPALAMLTAHATIQLVRGIHRTPAWIWKCAHAALVVAGIAIALGFWIAADRFEAIPRLLFLLGVFPVAIGVLGLWILGVRNESARLAMVLGNTLAACLLTVGVFGIGAGYVGSQNQMPLADAICNREDVEVAAFGCLESSWVYYIEKPIVELRTDGREDLTAVERLKDRKSWQRKPWLSPEQFAAHSDQRGLIITTAKHWQMLENKLPSNWKVLNRGAWFMKDEQLLLVGEVNSVAASADRSIRR